MGSFRPAVMDGVGVFVTLAGPSTSGKTKSGLRMARGLAGDKKIAAIDTEGKRMSHYSKEFDFDVVNMRSPFNGLRFSALAKEAEEAGYGALLTDTYSLEWSGVGGVLATYEELFAKENYNPKKSDICWSRAKSEHKQMANELLQLTIPMIFCVRANRVPAHLCKGGQYGPIATSPAGAWKIEQDKRFIYDWTVGFVLHPATPGKPRYDMVDHDGNPLWKCNDEHRAFFPEGQYISEETGEALRKWRFGEEARRKGSAAVSALAGNPIPHDEDDKAPPKELEDLATDALRDRTDAAVSRIADLNPTQENYTKAQAGAKALMEELEAAGRGELKTRIVEALMQLHSRIQVTA